MNGLSRLRAANGALRSWAQRRRRLLLTLAAALFLALLVWAALTLDLNAVNWRFFLLHLLIFAPLGVALNGAGISIAAWAVGRRLGLGAAIGAAAAGGLAEVTPAPGGLAARAAALYAVGAPPAAIATVLTGGAGVFVGLALAAAGAALDLAGADTGVATALSTVGAFGALLGAALLWRAAGKRALAVIAHRVLSLALALVRIWLGFAAVGAAIAWPETPLFAATAIVGALVFIAPAGLGIAEGAAAAIAPFVAAAPAAAVAALAQRRILTYLWCGAVMTGAAVFLGRKER